VTAAVVLRPAAARDRDRVLAWNNQPEVRARSLDPRPIDPGAHARWYAARLADPRTRLSIAVHEGRAVGLVRIERPTAGGPGRISIVIDPRARGRGAGRAAIAAACHADGGEIVAEILDHNAASRACFAAAGFAPLPAARADHVTAALGDLPPGAHRYLWRSA
jgi:UDP-2,4-diacetamido-2,4,6-trideoxy-beta-L-altropyranose hydrolase